MPYLPVGQLNEILLRNLFYYKLQAMAEKILLKKSQLDQS